MRLLIHAPLDARIAERLNAQSVEHRDEADESDAALQTAEQHAVTMRAEVAEPLTAQAEADGRDYLAAVADEAATTTRLCTTGRLGRRRAEHDQ